MKKEVLLLIQAKLDEARSKGLINSGISGLQKGIGRLRIQAEIDTASLKQSEKSMRGIISNLGNGIKSQLSQIPQAFQQHFSIANGVNALISQTRKSMAELREVNTILTEIGKTSSLTQGQLKAVGDASFEAANKYGSSASGYLYSVQEMYRAGYQNAGQMADLSALAQSAGGLDADLATDYLIASDAAYQYAGNAEKLSQLLDGQSQVTSRNAVSMDELASATKTAASQLANAGIAENELTALLGTGIATTRESGETVARAVRGIIMELQQVEGETGFETEVIDAGQLKNAEARCRSLGIALKSMQDGIVRLRDPIEVLRELSEAYNSLPDGSEQRSGILSDIDGKYRSNVLAAILSNWDSYEKMLGDYENAGGAAMDAAAKSSNSWEGSLNRLKNTWTETVGNIADSDAIISAINGLQGLISVLDKVTAALTPLGSIGLGVGLFAGLKNVGKPKMSGFSSYFANIQHPIKNRMLIGC